MSDSRLEKFIYAICSMDVSDLPVPLSRIEKLWNCLITGETPDFEPLSRNEKYLMAMLDRYDISNLPAPMSRGEKLLYKIAVGETDLSDVPGYLSRYEELLKYLIENGKNSEDDFEYVLYTLNQSLYTLYTTAEKPVKKAIVYGDTLVNTLQESSSLAVTPMGEDINAQQASVTGTANGAIKSAILKGCTLVNIHPTNYSIGVAGSTTFYANVEIKRSLIKPNTKYFLRLYNTHISVMKVYFKSCVIATLNLLSNNNKCAIFTTKGEFSDTDFSNNKIHFYSSESLAKEDVENTKILLCEYQDGMENWDIPYFEGMQSVKMPVLTTTGKNLFDGAVSNGYLADSTGESVSQLGLHSTNYMKCSPNSIYTISGTLNNLAPRFYFYDSDKKYLGKDIGINDYKTYTAPSNACYMKFRLYTQEQCDITLFNAIQVEEGSVATSYEPFKSNILTVNEDVELRGIGDVQDTLDCLTGEVTERIGEIVLDGKNDVEISISDSSSSYPSITRFWVRDGELSNLMEYSDEGIMCDKLPVRLDGDYEKITGSNGLDIHITTTKLSEETVEAFKEYLSQNPITVQYPLKTESVKTVDLTVVDQDGNTVPHLQAFNETTHISTSSTGLIPNVVIPATVSYPSIIKPSTLYTVKLKRSVTSGTLMINVGGTEQAVTSDCFTLTTPSTLTSQDVIFSGKGNVISEVTVVEGDQTAKEYGYFEGMQSVKMPGMTLTGKNLFDGVSYIDGYIFPSGSSTTTDVIRDSNVTSILFNVDKNTDYILSTKTSFDRGWVAGSLEPIKIGSKVAVLDYNKVSNTIKFNSGEYTYIMIYLNSTKIDIEEIQVEKGTAATQYEPYKSITLSTPSDLELRGIGNVKDELNLLTGELTQRIGEVVLDGSENWIRYEAHVLDGYSGFVASMPSLNNLYGNDIMSFISADFATDSWSYYVNNKEAEVVWNHDPNKIGIRVKSEKASNVTEIKEFLSTNNIRISYKLATESVKTVDLTVVDQDNQPTELGTFENITHVSLEAENLIPEVEMEVATRISTELASASPLMDDISNEQQQLETTVDEQSENVDATMIATTEIFEETL